MSSKETVVVEFSAFDFHPEFIEDGAERMLDLIDGAIKHCRKHGPEWKEIQDYTGDPDDTVRQYEQQVFQVVLDRLKKEYDI